MNQETLELFAEGLVELIIKRSVDGILEEAAKEGIRIPPAYIDAVKVGAAAGVTQTLLTLRQLGGLTTPPEPATI